MQFEIIAATPPGFAGVGVVRAAHAAGFSGALGLEDCGGEQREALLAALAASQTEFTVSIGALTEELCALLKASAGCARVILAAPDPNALERDIRSLRNAGLRVLVEVTSLADALAARDAGADGLIAKGNESGGAVGEETTLVLLQHLLGAGPASEAAPCGALPVFARGAAGLRTAAACLAAGAAGVVLDWQLSLCEESDVPEAVKARVAKMDGSETAILGEDAGARYRVYARPGETAWLELREIADRTGALEDPVARRRWREQVEARAAAGELLLIGQDAALARPLADEFRTVAGVCRAIRGEALRLCRVAHRLNVLRAGGPLAEAHGTRYPIVQGPMTRVSDRASFAVAVSQGGALPVLALALMRARDVDALLQETQQALAGSPWGVGILGFVPKELRDEQLAVVKKHRPPFAVIAGGRPDQAKALEDDGIRTYLHVPSPGLLDSFLESGARRFIFEGRECGGHVGPRTSFVLWELMIAVILKHLKESASASRADEYGVLFAGGIHDSLSAAMVSALAAPLAERGVRIGVLLGTGYLFTHEAVASGAIEPGFQQEVIACRDTLLLETGVGHSTRCANTPFGRYFAEEKRKLAREGRSREEIREALERLNLGRLHLASKGMRREETPDGRSSYVHVDDPEQRQEGLYMVGQVAALRHGVCTIAGLHGEIGRSADVLARHAPAAPGNAVRNRDVAVVGLACVFPQAGNPDRFWQNILNKVVAVREIPKERWDADLYFDADRQARDRIYSRWGGFLDDFPFDPVRYGMPPNTVLSVEPLQLLVLEIVRAALGDAGLLDRPFDRERTAVVLGTGGGVGELGLRYGFRSMVPHFVTNAGGTAREADDLIGQLGDHLPRWTEDSFAGLLLNVAAGRVANRFDLGGANYIVDAACATSLAALRLAVNELQSGASDIAIAAAADTMQSPFAYLCFSKTQALSPTGQCRTFDESADGIVISEGVAAAVLKRLEDAERDGDRIYAVLKGVGASSDGKDKGLTAPRPVGQMRALRRAYEKAGVAPETVALIEAHGTGTVAGDRAEVEALKTYFEAAGAGPQTCAVGSVKSMIGHTKCTAGFAGLIKAALALESKVLPPTTGVTKPIANLAAGPLYLNTEPRPWLQSADGSPRRAGVSAFGFGGTNFHAVLEEYEPAGDAARRPPPSMDWPAELFLWRAAAADEILDSANHLRQAIEQGAQPRLCDLAAAVYWEKGRAKGACCLAVVASSIEDLLSKIDAAKPALQAGRSFRDPRGIYYSPAAPETAAAEASAAVAGAAWETGAAKTPAPPETGATEMVAPVTGVAAEASAARAGAAPETTAPQTRAATEAPAARAGAAPETTAARAGTAPEAAAAQTPAAAEAPAARAGAAPETAAAQTPAAAEAPAAPEAGKIAFLFPGQGSQRVHMLADLAMAFPCVREEFERAEKSLGRQLGKPLGQFVFPPPSFTSQESDAREAELKDTVVAQPALGAAGLAMNRLLGNLGIHADFAAGHSYGEFVALCAAGAISPADLIRISEARGRLILEAARQDPGAMAAVTANETVTAGLLAEAPGVCLANLNAPLQTVVSGTRDGIAQVLAEAKRRGLSARGIPVACAFHSPLVAGARETLADLLRQYDVRPPRIPVYSNTTAAPHAQDPAEIRAQLAEHVVRPVRFMDEILAMYQAGARIFIEVGPGKVLTGLAAAALEGKPVQIIPMDQPGRNGLTHLMHALAQLAVSGVRFHAWRLFEGRVRQKLHLDRLVKETLPAPLSATTWTITAGRAVPPQNTKGAPAPARPAEKPAPRRQEPAAPLPEVRLARTPEATQVLPTMPLAPMAQPEERINVLASDNPTAPNHGALEAVMRGHHQLMSKFLDTHRSVMASFLAGGAAIPAQSIPAVAAAQPAGVPQPTRAPEPVRVPAPAPMAAPVAAAPPPAPAPAATAPEPAETPAAIPALTLQSATQRLLELVSGLTGYPPEMLNLDLNLEADLGIDSIKRVEIFAALQNAFVLPASESGSVEVFSQLNTLRKIAEWVHAQASGAGSAASGAGSAVNGAGSAANGAGSAANGAGSAAGETAVRREVTGSAFGQSPAAEPVAPSSAVASSAAASSPAPSATAPSLAAPSLAAPSLAVPSLAVPSLEKKTASLTRMVVTAVDAPLPDRAARRASFPAEGCFLITDDGGGVATGLSQRLEALGVRTQVINAGAAYKWIERVRSQGDRVTGLVHLAPLAPWPADADFHARLDIELKALFHLARGLEPDLRSNGAGRLIAATRLGGSFAHTPDPAADFWPGSGAAVGLVKTLAREWPEVACKAVDFEAGADADHIITALLDEIGDGGGALEVGYRDGRRLTLTSAQAPLALHGDGLALQAESVVLITGGARGVTAEVAIELARRFRCRLVLVGKSALPAESEPLELAAIHDGRKLKTAVIAMLGHNGQPPSPAAVEREWNRIHRDREIRATLAAIAQAGSAVEYHAVDVADGAAFGAFLNSLYDRFGALDGVIHGAGIIEDKLIADKSVESFDRVLAPKITGALTLAAALRPEKLRFLAFFSSVSARYGNRGQGDYAAANEVLNKLAVWLQARWPGRVVSIDWGPWNTGKGMVTPELVSRFEKAGIEMVLPAAGREAFVNELAYGSAQDAEVIWGGPVPPQGANGNSRAGARRFALLDEGSRTRRGSNGKLELLVEASTGDHVYLLDHQLNGKPVLPMAVAMELLAESAASHWPHLHLTAVHDLQVLQGVVFDGAEGRTFHVAGTGNGSSSHDPMMVNLEMHSANGNHRLHYRAKAELSSGPAQPKPGARLQLGNPRPLPVTLEEAHRQWLFHGPLFAGITRVEALGDNGIVGWLKPSSPAGFFTWSPPGEWLIDPRVIDSGLQLIILWARTYLDQTPLPSRLARYHHYGLAAGMDGELCCEVEIRRVEGSPLLQNDLKFFDRAGRLVGWLEGMEATCSPALNRLGRAAAASGASPAQ